MQCPGTAVAAGRYAWCPSQAHLVWEAGAGGWVVLEVLPATAVPILDDQVDGHLSLEAGDVAVTEVVAQVVDLGGAPGYWGGHPGGAGLGCTGTGAAFCFNSSGERAGRWQAEATRGGGMRWASEAVGG